MVDPEKLVRISAELFAPIIKENEDVQLLCDQINNEISVLYSIYNILAATKNNN